MANIKSQKKRIKTNEKAHIRNVAYKRQIKTFTRKVQDAVAEEKSADALKFALETCRLLDKAVSKGVIHKNQAANRKSGIMKLANTVVTDDDRKNYKPEPKKQPVKKGGSKKAKAKKDRQAAMKKESEEKAKRRQKTQKLQKAAEKKKKEAAKEEAKEETQEKSE